MISCAGGTGPDWLSQSIPAGLAKSAPQAEANVTHFPVLRGRVRVREIRMGDGVASTSQPWLAVTRDAGANGGRKKAPQKAPPGGGAEPGRLRLQEAFGLSPAGLTATTQTRPRQAGLLPELALRR